MKVPNTFTFRTPRPIGVLGRIPCIPCILCPKILGHLHPMASFALVENSKISWKFSPSPSKGPKFSAAPVFWIQIFGCAAILDQNFRLRRYSGSKFFGCAAILD